MWHGSEGPDGWGWIWMGVMMTAFWLPLLLIALAALRSLGSRTTPHEARSNQLPQESGGRELARRAYARGDIDRQHYFQLIEDLDRTETGHPGQSGRAQPTSERVTEIRECMDAAGSLGVARRCGIAV